MFDIGWSEILVIAIITVLVVGPKELPGLLRTVGKTIGNLRRMAGDFQNQFNEALREAELDDVKNAIGDVRNLNPRTAVKDAVQKQLGFDDDFADDLTEQVSQSSRDINSALSDAKVKSGGTDSAASSVKKDNKDKSKEPEVADKEPLEVEPGPVAAVSDDQTPSEDKGSSSSEDDASQKA
ncbi:sec-independent protein translocase protein TatB [Cohaesibacter sp. ES.047]|uniref:Sec-independent protein translocase protein TatB n=1 Tax=Cohaesibacter sp. ES.047 TaxID=1798205 RepID=UPI000BB809AD|nr:Sec-independent protein translocase protein TatB [Cohaesibacter sp. ES.047]SNY93645.1 sec-independent protein translocase protein TatB [Cohaesibacter sp. ES.047]